MRAHGNDINGVFCRAYARETMKVVFKHTTAKQRKESWTWRDTESAAEFDGPDNFYWYGSACCAAAAKANGWSAWLTRNGWGDEVADEDEVDEISDEDLSAAADKFDEIAKKKCDSFMTHKITGKGH